MNIIVKVEAGEVIDIKVEVEVIVVDIIINIVEMVVDIETKV